MQEPSAHNSVETNTIAGQIEEAAARQGHAAQIKSRANKSTSALPGGVGSPPAPRLRQRWNSIDRCSQLSQLPRSNSLEDKSVHQRGQPSSTMGANRYRPLAGRSLQDLNAAIAKGDAPVSSLPPLSPTVLLSPTQRGSFGSSLSLSRASPDSLTHSNALDFTEYIPPTTAKLQAPPTLLVEKTAPLQKPKATGRLRPAILGTVERPAYPTPPRLTTFRAETPAHPSGKNSARSSLGDFKLYDETPRTHRIALASLQLIDKRLREQGTLHVMSKDAIFGKKERDRDAIAAALDNALQLGPDPEIKPAGNRKGQRPSTSPINLIGSLLKSKKPKNTRAVMLHLLILAIHDQLSERACAILDRLSSATLVKKKPREANRAFLMAMALRLENVAMAMFDKGYPMDVNAPIYASGGTDAAKAALKKKKKEPPGTPANITFNFPSFFIVAIGMCLDNLSRKMMKKANINQSWFGLTPLIMAATRHGVGSAPMVKILLSYGADPYQGLYVEQLSALIKLQRGPGNSMAASKVFTFSGGGEVYGGSSNAVIPPSSSRPRSYSVSGRPSPANAKTMPAEYPAEKFGTAASQCLVSNANIERRRSISSSPMVKSGGSPAGTANNEFPISGRRFPLNRSSTCRSPVPRCEYIQQLDLSLRCAAFAAAPSSEGSLVALSESARKKRCYLVDSNRWTWMVYPVEFAAAVRNSDCVHLIIESFTNPKSLSNTHFGLLVQDDINVTSQLIWAGAPLLQKDIWGSTAFHLAARRGLEELIHLYVMEGINCNVEGEHRWTALHEAVSQRRKKTAAILVDAGARLDVKTDDEDTPTIVGAKVGLSAGEVEEYFDAAQLHASDRVIQLSVRNYMQRLKASSYFPPLVMFVYPPMENKEIFRKRADTAPTVQNGQRSDRTLEAEQNPIPSDPGDGSLQCAPKRKGTMQRFNFAGFRSRTVSAGVLGKDAAESNAIAKVPATVDMGGPGDSSPSGVGAKASRTKSSFGFRRAFSKK